MTPFSGKIFGIGFHKTGTTSLAAALAQLGYRVTGEFGVRNPRIAEEALDIAATIVPRFDAFQDNPWPILYRELDRRYPGSRFILTLRPVDEWLASSVNHFGERTTPMREWIYGVGSPLGNEALYRERYQRHNREVREYFRDRPGDLLELRITEGEGWDRLCPFLDKPLPATAFPHANKRA